MMSKVGMDNWNAPEMLANTQYSEKVDMWGLGCILYFIITGEEPFSEQSAAKLHAKIKNASFNKDHENLKNSKNNLLIDLICKLI